MNDTSEVSMKQRTAKTVTVGVMFVLTIALTTACGAARAQKTARVAVPPATQANLEGRAEVPRVPPARASVSIQDAINMQIHHVSLDFLDAMRFRDPAATVDDAVSMQIHHVSLDFVDELQVRYPSASIQNAVGLRIHHIPIAFVDTVRQRYPGASLDDIVAMRIHRVSLDFVDEVQRRFPENDR